MFIVHDTQFEHKIDKRFIVKKGIGFRHINDRRRFET